MKISTKLYISFWFISVFFILVSLFFTFQTYSLYKLTDKLNNHPLIVNKTLNKANFRVIAIQENLQKVAYSTVDLVMVNQTILVSEKQIYKHFNVLEKYFTGDKQELFKLIKLFDNWRTIRNEIINLHKNKEIEQATIVYETKSVPQVVKLERTFKRLTDGMVAKTTVFLDALYLQILKFLGISIFILIVVFIGAWIIFVILRKVVPNMALGFSIIDGIVTGNLQEQLQNQVKCDIDPNTSQLLQVLDNMQIKLQESITEVDKMEIKLEQLKEEKRLTEEALQTAFSSIVTNTEHF